MIRKSNSKRAFWSVEKYQKGFENRYKVFHKCGSWAYHDPPTPSEEKKGLVGIYGCEKCGQYIQGHIILELVRDN